MKKKKKFLIQTQEDLQEIMAFEAMLYYISFLGDAPAIKGHLTFNRNQAERNYELLLKHVIDMMNSAKTVQQRKEASAAFLSLHIMPLRIH